MNMMFYRQNNAVTKELLKDNILVGKKIFQLLWNPSKLLLQRIKPRNSHHFACVVLILEGVTITYGNFKWPLHHKVKLTVRIQMASMKLNSHL